VKSARAGIANAKEIYRSVRQSHLVAKTKAARKSLLTPIAEQSEELLDLTTAVRKHVGERCGRVKQGAAAKLKHVGEVSQHLLPPSKQGMRAGRVATEEVIHSGITAARAIPKGRGKGKFGTKWLLNRLSGGYLFGRRVAARADENKLPEEAVQGSRQVLGAKAPPKVVIYDRGASLAVAARGLKRAGVQRVGLPPRGQGAWLGGEQEQRLVKSERGKTGGSIGRLKSRKSSFSHRQERRVETQDAAGQRAIVAANVNTLMRDLVAQAKAAR
jgi:hypothetical protein